MKSCIFLISVCVVVILSSCSYMTGSRLTENIRVNAPYPVTIRDVYTGDTLKLNTMIKDADTFRVVRLQNGIRHALAFETDSSIAYRTTDLKRNWWGALNFLSYGLGCAVDQMLETSYHIDPQYFSKFTFNKLSPEQQSIIEDSLRDIERHSIPHSLIDKRTNFVVSVR
jgi:hypothetical protein